MICVILVVAGHARGHVAVLIQRHVVAACVLGVGKLRFAVIRGDALLGQRDEICIEIFSLVSGTCIPGEELVTVVTGAGRGTDVSAVGDTEVHLLTGGAPEEVILSVGLDLGMQEHTVLDLDPLGIDREAALRHSGKGRFHFAGTVSIPAVEDKAHAFL